MQNPDLFAKSNHSTAAHAKNYLESHKHLFKWNAPEDMLEIGCANGRIAKEVLFPFVEEYLRQLLGVDISQSAIDFGKKIYESSKLSLEQMNVEDETVAAKYEERFGHIFCFLLFQMVHRDDLWSKNIYKMLKPNGQLFATTLVNPCIYSKVLTSLKEDKTTPWFEYIENKEDLFVNYGSNPKGTFREILENAGFVVEEINVKKDRFTFPDLKHMTNTFLGIEPYSKYIPEELRDSYNEEYVKRCMKHTNQIGGYHNYSFDVVSFLATKK